SGTMSRPILFRATSESSCVFPALLSTVSSCELYKRLLQRGHQTGFRERKGSGLELSGLQVAWKRECIIQGRISICEAVCFCPASPCRENLPVPISLGRGDMRELGSIVPHHFPLACR